MTKLEDLIPGEKITSINETDAIIFEGHAVIQMLGSPTSKAGMLTFRDMANNFLRYILCKSEVHGTVQEIHVAFDRYDANTIKNQTREKRTSGMKSQEYHIQVDVQIPQNWNLFLSRSENKGNLARCYTEYMQEHGRALLKGNQVLYVSEGYPDREFRTVRQGALHYSPLASNQEESDTRIFLHAAEAERHGAQTIVISSPDTDVLVLLLHHRSSVKTKNIYVLTGHSGGYISLLRYISVHVLYERMSKEQHNLLLPIYCFTGCDSTNSFYGHGKKTAFRIMIQKAHTFQPLTSLGSNLDISKQEREACTAFVGVMYGKSGCDSLDKLRREKASKNVSPKKLPPTEDSLQQHILRTAYQLMLWRQANISVQNLPNPEMYGYIRDDDNCLHPRMMNQGPAAPELLNNLVCDCKDISCNASCTCLVNNQSCTAACLCEAQLPVEGLDACTNPFTQAAMNCVDSDSNGN